MVNSESLQLSDAGVVVTDHGARLDTLAGMYRTVFNRQAGLYGIAF